MPQLSIEDFLTRAAAGEWDLARVNITGGDRLPFYDAQLRSFWRDKVGDDKVGDDKNQVVNESFGLRNLLVDAGIRKVETPAAEIHPPTLLRLYPRPREFGYNEEDDESHTGVRSRRLLLWSDDGVIEGFVQQSDAASDLLVVPVDPWPAKNKGTDIRLPPLRLVDGSANVRIDLKSEKLGAFLGFNGTSKTLFGGLRIDFQIVDGKPLLDATLVPAGIEFKGQLPDPTRDFGGASSDSIEGTFRLECDTRPVDPVSLLSHPVYLLRLVAVKSQDAINKTEDRIALALASLASASAPIAIRYDKRPIVPPLLWQLEQNAKVLSLAKSDQDFEMQIEPTAIDVRVRTQGISSEERGLATIFVRSVTWKRKAKPTVELFVTAGTGITKPDEISSDGIQIAFKRIDGGNWTADLADIAERPFSAPLGPTVERLLPIYRAGGGLSQGAQHVPFVFLLVQEGWLQIALPDPPIGTEFDQAKAGLQPAQDEDDTPGSAMSGRVFASHLGTSRGVVLDDAAGIGLNIRWPLAGDPTPDQVHFFAEKPKGQLLGMLYVSETSPNSREALPSLRGGPASTRDIPLWFGGKAAEPSLKGNFSWNHKDGSFTGRFTVLPVTSTEKNAAAISWLPPKNSAYISNFALTRSLPSVPDPSASRGLLPRRILPPASGQPIFELSSDPKASLLPKLSANKTGWFHFLAETRDDDRLILPTLPGTEFRLDQKEGAIWFDKAMLRFDLPILDELFAWSDPPKQAASSSSTPPVVEPPAALPTALQPMELAETWEASRNRMALTRTQAAQITDWINVATAVTQKIGDLVAPYGWPAEVTIHPEAFRGWGEFALDNVKYSHVTAAEGLGGDTPVPFTINGAEIKKGDGPIKVAGFAANLYKYKAKGAPVERIWDSRGFGLSSQAQQGIRDAGYLASGDKDEKHIALLTSNAVTAIKPVNDEEAWSFPATLGFLVRDLPLDGATFNGDAEASLESARGTNGQAFKSQNFPYSLSEWRFFEMEEEGAVKRHDIQWGPFSFKPLRLRHAVFDDSGKPTAIVVLGSMRFDPAATPNPEGPFGPDNVYARDDLFTLTLTYKDDRWTYEWTGVDASFTDNLLKLNKRNVSDVEFSVPLSNAAGTFLESARDIRTIVRVNIANAKPTAEFEFRLFGADHRHTGIGLTPTDGGFTAELPVEAFSKVLPKGPTCVQFEPTKASVAIEKAKGELCIEARLGIYAQLSESELAAAGEMANDTESIVTLEKGKLTWLGIEVPINNSTIDIDHETGVFSWRLEKTATESKSAPFGFEAADLQLSGALIMAAPAVTGSPSAKILAFEMSSAWAQFYATDPDDADRSIEHALLSSRDGIRDHALHITWTKLVHSPIRWPELAQLQDSDGNRIPHDWLTPAGAKHDARNRRISIAADPKARLEHEITFSLRRHRIDGDSLALVAGIATVDSPVRLLAVAIHTLGPVGAQSKWTTLDHIVITTPKLMLSEGDAKTFAPLEHDDKYRGAAAKVVNGIAKLSLAAAGFHDKFLSDQWWNTGGVGPVILGGAVAQFPDGKGGAYTTVVPWIDVSIGMPAAAKSPLNTKAGTWRVASADLWSASPQMAGPMATVVIGTLADGRTIDDQLSAGRFTPDGFIGETGAHQIIPVEQAYFEKRNGDAYAPLTPADLEAAPFFLRAMMAVAARRDLDIFTADRPIVDWNATTLQAGRFLSQGKAILKPATPAVRIGVRADPPLPPPDPLALLVADLIVLSRGRATRLDRYRRVAPGAGDDISSKTTRDELAQAAVDVDANVLIAARVVSAPGAHPGVSLREIARPLAGLPKGKALTLPTRDVGPSAALGWPTETGTRDLAKLGPALGDELPLLGHDSGFAGRFQMFGWPAFAAGSADETAGNGAPTLADPSGLYVSFSNQIAYERGSAAGFSFDGPAARHLLPSVARRRAPLSKAAGAVLDTVLRPIAGADDAMLVASGMPRHKQAAAILPPAIERGTVGRRPGVMETSVTSITIPADEAAFDRQLDHFGRPANSGPFAAHQLRNPRSPVLPADRFPLDDKGGLPSLAEMERVTFGLRRRTYVSMADIDRAGGKLDLFHAQDGLADAARFEFGEPGARRHYRALFSLNSAGTVSASWSGLAKIEIEVASLLEGIGVEPVIEASGSIVIGALSSPVLLSNTADGPFDPVLKFNLVTGTLFAKVAALGKIQAALHDANADTPLRLVLDLKDNPQAGITGALPPGPRRQAVLPLMLDPGSRRVLSVRTKTIIFGDPSYDRQLASQTKSAPTGGAGSFTLAADRVAYDLGVTLYFAGGLINTDSGEFEPAANGEYDVSFSRLPQQTPAGDQPPPQPLILQGIAPQGDGSYRVANASVFEIILKKLVSSNTPPSDSTTDCPLVPGDRLELVARPVQTPKEYARIQVDIVAEPVIAPPPSVFSVIETSGDVARVRLHAAAPLPQKLEFPNLLKDLALGHVRRRALFVWSYALAGSVDEKSRIDLLKFDRSGGAQIEKP
ncbi:MAG: hypothetical protein JWL86_3642 [Rhizobium sp.]|nr:hypothetical protein [Rhizobium sp.]